MGLQSLNGTIGVVGGVGPYAGTDLLTKIFDNTVASRDQEHLPVILMSLPELIADRTPFILGESRTNPGEAIANVILRLQQAGATVAGIPCNTAHSTDIFETIQSTLRKEKSTITLLHMIQEVVRHVKEQMPSAKKLGLLSTLGTARSRIYPKIFEPHGFEIVLPEEKVQTDLVHAAIYDLRFGIKAQSHPVTEKARRNVEQAVHHLQERKVDAIILGCTELPLAVSGNDPGLPFFDPAEILARALIRETHPHKLKKLSPH